MVLFEYLNLMCYFIKFEIEHVFYMVSQLMDLLTDFKKNYCMILFYWNYLSCFDRTLIDIFMNDNILKHPSFQ